ncbi:MAG: hypothetical protein JWR63_1773 [Conexibacter sp.]|nr:hypothetical protein [Conexibacter sp.]MCW2999902.1 hypothetical protein [Solirubrobacterales bacterium]
MTEAPVFERACALAFPALYAIEATSDWTYRDAGHLMDTVVRHSLPRRRVAPLMEASLGIALQVSYYLTEGYGGMTEVEEMLDSWTQALGGYTRRELRVSLAAAVDEMAPLCTQFAARVADPKAGWHTPPGYTYRLQELSGEVTSSAAVLLVL